MKRLLVLLLLGTTSAMSQSLPLQQAIKDFPRSELSPRTPGPFSIPADADLRKSYAALAEAAGLNILFDVDLRTVSTPAIENLDLFDALDRLARQTATFVEVLDEKTLIVAPDNPSKRRDYELQVIKTFRLANVVTPQDISQVVTALRSTLNARYIAANPSVNSIVIRDTPNRITTAERIIADLDKRAAAVIQPDAIATNATGDLFVQQAGNTRRLSPSRSPVQVAAGPSSFKMDQSSRAAFEALAQTAGLNIIFDRDFRSTPVQFRVDNMEILDALDRLALQTRSFWTAIDSKTILVAPDNPAKRREFDRVLAKTFYLPNASATAMSEIVTSLRTLLNLRYVATTSATNALLIRDTPNRLAIAEKLITDLSPQPPVAGSTTETPLGSESGFVLNRRASRSLATAQSPLQMTVSGPFSFDMNESVRRGYEDIAARAGLRVVFDNRFRDTVTALKLQNVAVIDVLDFLSLQTANIWEVMDANTIIVGPDAPTVRNELATRAAKTIRVSNVGTEALAEILTALRTILNLRHVDVGPSAIVIEDTTANIAFAEKIVSDLDRPARR